ncbi:MAG: hypothetical protein IID46_16365 [Planctomycetes bacterium]|nr:hypothetical protein [Planctomycetota bacterium]
MNRYLKIIFLVVASFSVALTLLGESGERTEPVVRNTRLVSRVLRESEKLQYLGVQSCAAANCHGGRIDQSKAQTKFKGAEYSRWILDDPHAHAMSTLYNKESRHIYSQLRKSPSYKNLLPPHQAPLCLNCHSSPTSASGNLATLYETRTAENKTESESLTLFRDGIGCEACHGPAEKWLEPHKRPDWVLTDEQKLNHETVLADANKKSELGFQNTKDVFTRARMCAQCHVGAPGREVNHDLIAAGHPRLTFEFSDYLARMPHHWNRSNDHDREFLVWASGQLAATDASLEVLERRAGEYQIWPELAELDCFSCHHDLQASGWRGDSASPGHAPGQMRWGAWNSTMLPLLADFARDPEKNPLLNSFDSLKSMMERPLPPARQVADAARTLREEYLSRWEVNLKEIARKPDVATRLLKRICNTEGPQFVDRGWDSASQVYLALKALVKDDRQLPMQPSQDKTESYRKVDDALESFRLLLEYPAQFDSPKQKKQPESRTEKMRELLKMISLEFSKP